MKGKMVMYRTEDFKHKDLSLIEDINRSISISVGIIGCIIIFCSLIIIFCFGIRSVVEKEGYENLQSSIQTLTVKIDSFRTELKGCYQAIQNSDTLKTNRYTEQCRVDSIQDAAITSIYTELATAKSHAFN
jgi:hypothetical protein